MNPEIFDAAAGAPCLVALIADPSAPAAPETLALVANELHRFGLTAETPPVTPSTTAKNHARHAASRGRRVLVVAGANAGFAAELAAETPLPVLRVPVGGTPGGSNLDLLWPESPAITETPATGGAYATLAIGEAGARNAALFVVSMLALTDERLRERWREFRQDQTRVVLNATLPRD